MGRVLKWLFALILVGIPFAAGIWLFVLCLVGVAIVALVRRYGFQNDFAPVLWWSLLLVVTGVFIWLRLWPTPSATASCSTSPLPLYGYLSPPAPYATGAGLKAQPRSQVEIEVQRFDARRVELLQDAEDSEQGFGRLGDGYSILNNLAKKQGGVDLGPLRDRLSKLHDRLAGLAEPGQSQLDAIRKRRANLQNYLDKFSQRSKDLQESAIPEFDKRFNEGLENVSLEDVHSDIAALDNALTTAVDNALGGDLNKRIDGKSQLSAVFIEPATAELRESVAITLNDAEITQIDASGLEIGSEVLRSRLSGAQQRFELFFAGGKQQTPNSLGSILIPPGVRDIIVRSILSIPVPLTNTCVKSPLIKFSLLQISWPEPYPVTLTATMNLTGTDIKDYRYRFEPRRDSSIQDITLPARSFFASNFAFHVERMGDNDVLTPDDPNQKLDLAYFRAQSLWIELLPEEMRYGWVQRHRDLFFRDNAMSLLGSLWLGAIAARITIPKKKEKS